MCGIVAVYDSLIGDGGNADELTANIESSLGFIAHRGPDATGVWVNDDASCGEHNKHAMVL